ncbi:uncharacterized protein B0H18DRAFT_1185968 [Fomitopsis serialis]|uniref:uncharacterized protein n=1 Tax=Fomitopsis serialis TaxID=139415 RepID=UPI002008E741|nr:uncharacterized protein B0H18DRAFT_1185968 [Neoantrodia serialis]KAH9922118.1 hypothetical protein B0H18DRAFT_1185968 [Neoantrodia serialis]
MPPDSYEDLVALSGETFGLSVDVSNVRFYTQELAGSKGINVEITKGAWDAIKTLLTEALSRMSLAPDDKRHRASRRSFVLPSPARPSKASEDRKSREPVSHLLKTMKRGCRGRRGRRCLSEQGRRQAQVVASEDEEDEEVEDELDDELREEEAEGGVAEASSSPRKKTMRNSCSYHHRRHWRRNLLNSCSPSRHPPRPQPRRLTGGAHLNAASVLTSSPTPKSSRSVTQPLAQDPNPSKKKGLPGPDERFVVIIEYDDGSDEETQTMFKTRGRHTVSKVLMQACRTFGIEELYDKTQLVLAIDTEEDGEIVEHRFMCPKDETMANVGAVAESRFIVQVEDDL